MQLQHKIGEFVSLEVFYDFNKGSAPTASKVKLLENDEGQLP